MKSRLVDPEKARLYLRELNLLDFLDDSGISYIEVGKNIGQGWIGINPCPNQDCGDENNHFGINILNKSINCWKCNITGTLIKFLMMYYHISHEDAFDMIEKFINKKDDKDQDIEEKITNIFTKPKITLKKIEKTEEKKNIISIPGDPITMKMINDRPMLRNFMRNKNLTQELCFRFGIRYDWKQSLRLILPIFDERKMIIGYQGRDVTGKAMLRYITKPDGLKLGEALYHIPDRKLNGNRTIIIVEGILDLIRTVDLVERHLPKKQVAITACFTNKPTVNQLILLNSLGITNLITMLDNDSWYNYKKFSDLSFNITPIILPPEKDPNSLTDQDFITLDLKNVL